MEALERGAGMRALDMGCGQVEWVRAFVDMGAAPQDVAGVDLRQNAIEEGRKGEGGV
jgi:hypothetical protein